MAVLRLLPKNSPRERVGGIPIPSALLEVEDLLGSSEHGGVVGDLVSPDQGEPDQGVVVVELVSARAKRSPHRLVVSRRTRRTVPVKPQSVEQVLDLPGGNSACRKPGQTNSAIHRLGDSPCTTVFRVIGVLAEEAVRGAEVQLQGSVSVTCRGER
ncbi:MAG TPA: hypothetical protein VIO16_01110 [Dehalococcoidia bacterium]